VLVCVYYAVPGYAPHFREGCQAPGDKLVAGFVGFMGFSWYEFDAVDGV